MNASSQTCEACGSPLESGTAVCPNCGQPVSPVRAAGAPAYTHDRFGSPLDPPPTSLPPETSPAPTARREETLSSATPRRGFPAIVWVVVAVAAIGVFCLLAGLAVYLAARSLNG